MTKNNNSSFGVGFTTGLVAGAVGYYLFATSEGEKLRKNLDKKWRAAQKDLIKQGVISKGQSMDIHDLIAQAKSRLVEFADFQTPESTQSKKPKRQYRKQKNPQQFKGV